MGLEKDLEKMIVTKWLEKRDEKQKIVNRLRGKRKKPEKLCRVSHYTKREELNIAQSRKRPCNIFPKWTEHGKCFVGAPRKRGNPRKEESENKENNCSGGKRRIMRNEERKSTWLRIAFFFLCINRRNQRKMAISREAKEVQLASGGSGSLKASSRSQKFVYSVQVKRP